MHHVIYRALYAPLEQHIKTFRQGSGIKMLYLPYIGFKPTQRIFNKNVDAVVEALNRCGHADVRVDYLDFRCSLFAMPHFIECLVPELKDKLGEYDVIVSSSIGSPTLQNAMLNGAQLKLGAKIVFESGPTGLRDIRAMSNQMPWIPPRVLGLLFDYVMALGLNVSTESGYDAIASLPNSILMLTSNGDPFVDRLAIRDRFAGLRHVTLIELAAAPHLHTLCPRDDEESTLVKQAVVEHLSDL